MLHTRVSPGWGYGAMVCFAPWVVMAIFLTIRRMVIEQGVVSVKGSLLGLESTDVKIGVWNVY